MRGAATEGFEMRSITLLSLLWICLVGCASTVEGVGPGMSDAGPGDRPAAEPDGPRCAPPPPLAPVAACAARTEVATPGNVVAGAVDTYQVEATAREAEGESPCVGAMRPRGDESRLRFTAPRGGLWRFTATGPQLFSFRALRGCTGDGACQRNDDLRGEHLSATFRIDLMLERGASAGLTLGGCPSGRACRYTLRAQRIGALTCGVTTQDVNPCPASDQVCVIDVCDPERLRCTTPSPMPVRAVRVLRDATTGRHTAVGTLAHEVWGGVIWVRWYDAGGVAVPRGDNQLYLPPGQGLRFAHPLAAPPAGAARARFWVYTGGTAEPRDAVEAAIEAWSPPGEGGACDTGSFETRCADGLRCEGADGSAAERGNCRRTRALTIDRLDAWRDTAGTAVHLVARGARLTSEVWALGVELLDDAGAVLARAEVPSVSVSNVSGGFTATMRLDNAMTFGVARGMFRVTPAATRVRVVAIDRDRRMSGPMTASMRLVGASALGEACDGPSLTCAEGLRCEALRGTNALRCAPVPDATTCPIEAGALVWSPPAARGTYTLDGLASSGGASTRCGASRAGATARGVFVAPREGRYTFTMQGLESFEVQPQRCEAGVQSMCEDSGASAMVRLTEDLIAGQRVNLTAAYRMGGFGPRAFTLQVEVP